MLKECTTPFEVKCWILKERVYSFRGEVLDVKRECWGVVKHSFIHSLKVSVVLFLLLPTKPLILPLCWDRDSNSLCSLPALNDLLNHGSTETIDEYVNTDALKCVCMY